MYRKGSVLEIQFSPERLNDGAGDPYWIDLTLDEARRLYEQLAARFATDAREPAARHVLARLISAPFRMRRRAFTPRRFHPAAG